jgi:hypothetical protein
MSEETKPAEQAAPKKPIYTGEYRGIKPRCWQNKKNQKYYKVVPWFQPFDTESEFDFVGLMREIDPTIFTDDLMGDFHVHKGLLLRMGWLIYTENQTWWGVPYSRELEAEFEDLGLWEDKYESERKKFDPANLDKV